MIYQGAEAKILISRFLNRDVIVKKRLHKSYRIQEIDDYLINYRTKTEAKIIMDARKNSVPVPIIYDVDLINGIIIMELIKGERVKDIFDLISDDKRISICERIGRNIARLHKNNIIHGDITTSNMIERDDDIFFIDFGLSSYNTEIEAQGVDLHVLMEAIESTHSNNSDYFKYVLDSYMAEYGEGSDLVVNKINEIVKRGRYR